MNQYRKIKVKKYWPNIYNHDLLIMLENSIPFGIDFSLTKELFHDLFHFTSTKTFIKVRISDIRCKFFFSTGCSQKYFAHATCCYVLKVAKGIKRAKSRGVNNKNWIAGWARTWQLHSKLTVAVVKVRERLYLALSCPSVGHSLCH